MTETPSDPAGPGEYNSGYESAPPPPAPAGAAPAGGGYQQPAPGYQPPPAYAPPPPGTEAPAAQAPAAQAPAGQHQAPAPGYPPPPPPGTYQEQPPATPGGFQTAAAGFGGQFANYDRTALQNFNPRTVDPMDWGIIAAGVVAFIFSLLHFYKYTLTVAGIGKTSASVSAWHGFFGWFGALVALLAALLLAAELIARIRFPFVTRLVVLGGFGLALLCELLALFVVPGNTGGVNGAFGVRIDKGHSYGYWITLLAVLVGTALAFKRFTDTGGKLPRRG